MLADFMENYADKEFLKEIKEYESWFNDKQQADEVNVFECPEESEEEQYNLKQRPIQRADFKFKMITPNIQFNMLGDIIDIFKTQLFPFKLYTYENAQFCLRFAIDTALCVQKNRVIGFLFNEDKLPKYQVLKKSKVIVIPHSKEIEEIYEANEGERFLGYYENYNTKNYVGILLDDNVAYIKSDDVKEI